MSPGEARDWEDQVDQLSFDHLAKRLGASVSRRASLAGIIGAVAGLAGISHTDAGVARPPVDCRSTGMQCNSSDECCSTRCIAKADGTSRCARKTSNRKKKHGAKNGGGSTPVPGPNCTVCANGCPHSTIEAAVAAADTYSVITVAPGEYTPLGTGNGAIEITKSLVIYACDPANRPTIYAEGTVARPIFHIAKVDDNDNCIAPIDVYLDSLIISGVPGSARNAIYAKCDSTWSLTNALITDFTDSPSPLINTGPSMGMIVGSSITANALTATTPLLQFTNATATLNNTLVANNSATGSMISAAGSSSLVILSGSTNIYNNTVTDNTTDGAGVNVSAGCTLSLRDSAQIVNNSGVGVGGGIYAASSATVNDATSSNVNGNTAIVCNNYWKTSCVIS